VNISTLTYDKNYIKQQLDKHEAIDSNRSIKNAYEGIEYNSLYEINGQLYNDYESGNIAANVYKTKNQYDCTYSMRHQNNHILKNARNYVGIEKCNNTLYLKYVDVVKYEKTSQKTDNANMYGMKLPNIEIVKAVQRNKEMTNHATNMYSIAINTDILS